jgi:hypothetical protein
MAFTVTELPKHVETCQGNDSERDQPEDTHSDHGLGAQTHSYHEDATQPDRFNRDDDFTRSSLHGYKQ